MARPGPGPSAAASAGAPGPVGSLPVSVLGRRPPLIRWQSESEPVPGPPSKQCLVSVCHSVRVGLCDGGPPESLLGTACHSRSHNDFRG